MKNKVLADAKELHEIKQFQVHRETYEKLRQGCASSSSGNEDSFQVEINSKGKLDDFKEDITPIDEMNEILDESALKKGTAEEMGDFEGTLRIDPRADLFEFSPLLLNQTQTVRPDTEHEYYHRLESMNTSNIQSNVMDENELEFGETFDETRNYTHITANRTFDRKTLQ